MWLVDMLKFCQSLESLCEKSCCSVFAVPTCRQPLTRYNFPNKISDRKVFRASRPALVALISSLLSILYPPIFQDKNLLLYFLFLSAEGKASFSILIIYSNAPCLLCSHLFPSHFGK